MKCKLLFTIFAVFVFAYGAKGQRSIYGEVTDVLDGSTIVVTSMHADFRVRLQYIDPPYPNQPLYDVVKAHLSQLVKGKSAVVKASAGSPGVWAGQVLIDDRDISVQMLRDGAAWYSVPEAESQPENDRSDYMSAERLAKDEKRGIWGIADIQPAWQIRVARDKADKEQADAERKAATEQLLRNGVGQRITYGMSLNLVLTLCGNMNGDRLSATDIPGDKSAELSLEYTRAREPKGCYGDFSFNEQGKLEKISRTKE